MRFVIVTGLSGAGKTQATRNLEDLGYFCVDNLPPTLIPKFAEACVQSNGKIEKIALVIDIRGGAFFDALFESLKYLEEHEFSYEILFLDASDEVLVKRFKETRRTHPLAQEGRVIKGIELERQKLSEVKTRADIIIDTSKFEIKDLRAKIYEIYGDKEMERPSISITVLSFGFKYGIPVDSDLVFDVRFMPNPFYVQELRKYSGNDRPVRDFVMAHEEAQMFTEKLKDMVDYLIPNYQKEGKRQLIISIGCTGGRHRSVTIANELYDYLSRKWKNVTIEHRDINEDINRGGGKL